jgi:hypothetical protein
VSEATNLNAGRLHVFFGTVRLTFLRFAAFRFFGIGLLPLIDQSDQQDDRAIVGHLCPPYLRAYCKTRTIFQLFETAR